MKTARNIFLLLLALCIALPLCFFDFRKDAVSDITNAKLPELDFSRGIDFDTITEYVSERIGLHDKALTAYQLLNAKLFHELVHPLYCYGQNGYIFYKVYSPGVDTEYLDAFCEYLAQIHAYCEGRGVPFLYCITPSKTTVYSRYLPKGYAFADPYHAYLVSKLTELGVPFVDNCTYLTEVAKTEQIYNVQYDAGHWNDLGELYGTANMISALQEVFPALHVPTLEDYSLTWHTATTLPTSDFPIEEEVPVLTYLHPEAVTGLTSEYAGLRISPEHSFFSACRTEHDGETLPRTLFFQGSYYNRNTEMMRWLFGETYSVHNYENILDFEYYFNIFQPECVILESAEYATSNYYFNLDGLRSASLAPLPSDLDTDPVCSASADDEVSLEEAGITDLAFAVPETGRLVTLTADCGTDFTWGYFVTDGHTYTLEKTETGFSLTFDGTLEEYTSGTVVLY